MNQRIFNTIGWLILLGMTITWIFHGYTNIFLLLLPIVVICFSIYDGSIKKLKIINGFSVMQVLLMIGTFILAVAIAFGIIQGAGYVIREFLHLQGWIKAVIQFIVVIFALYPAKYLFGTVLLKVVENVKAQRIS